MRNLRGALNRLVGGAVCLGLMLAFGGCQKPAQRSAAAATRQAPHAEFAAEVQPVLSQYCVGCHNADKHKGDVVLDRFTNETAVLADRGTWEKILKNVRSRAMPPETKPQPTEEQRKAMATWIENKLFYVDCRNPDPGRVTIRRLNRSEYNNSIRDLVGVNFRPADDFPGDDVGYGFDNIGDVLSMPPILLEKYLAAAEKILDSAIVVPGGKPKTTQYPGTSLTGPGKPSAYTSRVCSLTNSGEIYVDAPCTVTGEYEIAVRAFEMRAGEAPSQLTVRAGGKPVRTFEVRATEQSPEFYRTKVQLAAGTNRLALEFTNPATVTNTPNGNGRTKDQRPRVRARRLLIDSVELVEPSGLPSVLPESHRRIFVCEPAHTNADACAMQVIEKFSEHAFRRPVAAEELGRLKKIYDLARKEGEPFERGIELALEAVLVSPHFLFRGEITPDPDNPKAVHRVSDYALASRLSYFLWSSMPDAELFALASRGQLHQPRILETQVRRMLKDPKSRSLVENFTGQWLQIRNLARVTPDTNAFPGFTEAIRADMERETELFFECVMREDRSILDFIDGRYTFVNARLAAYYGLPATAGDEFQKVMFKSNTRGGVLTHGSVLTITSNPGRTSPVKRGKWVLDNLLGTPPPPPPPDVPDLKDQKELTGSLRQKMEQHRKNPSCASCHERMDPIGFGLENFNAIGVWREKDGDLPIDASGTLPGGKSFAGPAELRKILRGQKDLFAHCLTEKMLTYALGRGLEYYDRCAVDQITSALANHDYRFSVLITEIVRSVPFQMRRGDSDGAQVAGN